MTEKHFHPEFTSQNYLPLLAICCGVRGAEGKEVAEIKARDQTHRSEQEGTFLNLHRQDRKLREANRLIQIEWLDNI